MIWPSASFTPSQDLCFTPLLSLSSSRFNLQFDMVTEQADLGPLHFATSFCPVKSVTTTTVTMTRPITSSSREEREILHWGSKLQEESDIKMFTNDPKLNPRLPSPTSFDGVKPSHVENCSRISQSLTIKSSSRSFWQSEVTTTSSQRRSLSRESCQRSLSRSRKGISILKPACQVLK